MASDTLSRRECERFYRLRDTLAVYAHALLGVEEEILFDPDNIDPEAPLFNEHVVRDTLTEVWADPSIIDAFIEDNPAGLPQADLAVIKTWKAPLTGHFTVFEHAGALLFLADGRLYHVTGLLEPVKQVLTRGVAKRYGFPRLISGTLLPFEGRIVYDGFFTTFPVQMGAGMKAMVDDDVARALSRGEHVSTAERLMDLASVIAEERIKREADRMIEELELDMRAGEQLPGHHAGALVGMSEEERERAIREHLRSVNAAGASFDFAAHLREGCTKGPVKTGLAELISTEKKYLLQRWSHILGLPHDRPLTKAQLVENLVPMLSSNDFLPLLAIQGYDPSELAAYRALCEEGGVRRVAADGITSFAGLPPVGALMCYLFLEGDEFVFVIPEELRCVLASIDWDEQERIVRDFQRAADIADALASLRGIARMDEAYAEFKRCYPDSFGFLDFDNGVRSAIEQESIGCDLLDDGTDVYVLHYELGNIFREENGIEVEDFPDPLLEGPLGQLEMILQAQEGKTARTLDEDMRASGAIYEWRERRPAVRALRDYLDAHVPDGADDYCFADGVIEDLIEHMSTGIIGAEAIRMYYEILEEHGYVPDEAHLHKVTDLLMNMANAMPTWLNNGWAPAELHEAMTGQKVFYNEDGSVMKVGRNDPCPCGSGKKYKKCCGR